ncbi:thioredoxin family protein [Macrococcus hajekii]|uniref:Thioredoxin family protein n=1 Tax=Macrococcus hajekii TaxID=198482 RepID=A0A4R6BIB4_9STAP|nr:thioredoxin family protein [Macrococcus hajekii]TDM01359.1 thioredoxin family protein [Macrococcus hajekii]GGB10959.1 thioredoxin [Macrococcus hajekii]
MTTLMDYFNNGLTLEAYKSQMNVNREDMEQIYEQFDAPHDLRLEDLKDKNMKVIAITEDWCGDAMMNIPVLLKIAEQADIDVRFVLRDSHLELIDQYLTNGTARSIPIFIFLDRNGQEAAVWGPRAQAVQAFIDDSRQDLPSKEDSTFEEKSKEKHKLAHDRYKQTPEFWHAIYHSIANILTQ